MTGGRVVASLLQYPPARFIGSETLTHHWFKALMAGGFSAGVYVLDQGARLAPWEYEGVGVRYSPYLAEEAPQVLLCHADFAVNVRMMARRRPGIKVVLVAHNSRSAVVDGLALTPHDLAIATSRATAVELNRPDMLVVRPPAPPVAEAFATGSRYTLINLSPDKGSMVFADVAHFCHKIPFLAVEGGYGGLGPDSLRSFGNVEIQPHVPFPMMDDEVWDRTKVLLMPSRHESWGMVASEAISRGIPVIAHPTPGLVENLGEAGIWVDRGDVSGWIDAVQSMEDPGLYTEAREKAFKRARARVDDTPLFVQAMRELIG